MGATLDPNNGGSAIEVDWMNKVRDIGQTHIIPKDADPKGVKLLVDQLKSLDDTYAGGLTAYVNRAKRLLLDSKNGVSPFEDVSVEVPEGANLKAGSADFDRFEHAGMEEMKHTCFVLVAGGLGERLGYSGIKIGLPTDMCTEMLYVQLYAQYILAHQQRILECTKISVALPFVLMTSDDTHDATAKLFNQFNFFGLSEKQVVIMKQDKVPALINDSAHFAVSEDDPYKILTKPHGHGDVHSLLYRYGLPNKWAKEGYKWIVLFQDTNSMVFRAIPSLLGVSRHFDFAMNSLAIPRKPGDAVGALCKLRKPDGTVLSINVEYNVFEPLLKNSNKKEEVDSDGYSIYPGNANVLVFNIPVYASVLQESRGAVPEFVNPKYKDETKASFKTPTRLECMMQEFARLLTNHKVGVTQMEKWLCFSTVKNNIEDGRMKFEKGLAQETAMSAEAELYEASRRLLILAVEGAGSEISIEEGSTRMINGAEVRFGPQIVLLPSWGLCLEDMRKRFQKGTIKISSRSSLTLDGGVIIKNLQLDGAAEFHALPNASLKLENTKLKNDGWSIKLLEAGEVAEEKLRIRGYKILKHDQQKEIVETGDKIL